MVRALERHAVAFALRDQVTAVAADVHESAQDALGVADDHDRDLPAKQVKKSPMTRSARLVYCHVRAKMRSPSSRWIAGSAYQSAGSVAPAARRLLNRPS